MLEVASVGSLTSAAISCGESLFDALVPANGDLSFSEANVRSAFFLDDFERALRPLRWSVFARDIENWSLLTMPRAELSDYHDWLFTAQRCGSFEQSRCNWRLDLDCLGGIQGS